MSTLASVSESAISTFNTARKKSALSKTRVNRHELLQALVGGVVVRARDLAITGRRFDCRPPPYFPTDSERR